MLTDVLTGWTAETLGGLTVLTTAGIWAWVRRRGARPAAEAAAASAAAGSVRMYTLLGARAAGGQPVHLPSGRPAGTEVVWAGPSGEEKFKLTDGMLPDGAYAAERLSVYRG
ncbi:hypothetical protein [Streptomyces erythrochromogenes]|uniref:hypothetical protein n=1 Tax=Streptomyces erythrochromogenes TaxID=285574 RepID=UPI0036A027E8